MDLGPLPKIGQQPPPEPSPGRRSTLRLAAIAIGLVATVGAVVALAANRGGASDTKAAATPADTSYDGTVYIETNDRRKNANGVLAYRYRKGSFRPLSVREYPAGGSGSHDLTNAGVLDAEQQIVTNADRTLLFAVNTGSDTVAAFHIADDGTLDPVAGSPSPSRGKAPASVGVSGDALFVANKAQDGIRDLSGAKASYATFHIEADGSLTPIGTPVQVPARSSPTETYVPPHTGHLMISTEESGPFRAFTVGDDGSLHQGPNSPVALDKRVYPKQRKPDYPVWPQGLAAHPTLPLLYAGVANVRRLVVYSYD